MFGDISKFLRILYDQPFLEIIALWNLIDDIIKNVTVHADGIAALTL